MKLTGLRQLAEEKLLKAQAAQKEAGKAIAEAQVWLDKIDALEAGARLVWTGRAYELTPD